MFNNYLSRTLEDIESNLPECSIEELIKHPSQTFMELPFPLAPELVQKITQAIQNIKFQLYPKAGTDELESLLVSKLALEKNKDVMISNGGVHGLDLLVHMISHKKNARVLLLYPDFFMFKVLCLQHKVSYKEFDYQGNLLLDLNGLCDEIRHYNPDLILMSNPNSLLGAELQVDTLKRIIEATNGLVLIDEVYAYFSSRNAISLMKNYDNLLILSSFSKIGLAAIRFGFLCGNRDIIRIIKKLRKPFSINALTIEVAKIAIRNFSTIEEKIIELVSLRERMTSELMKINNIVVFPSCTNFIVIELNRGNVEDVYHKLISFHVPVRNCAHIKQMKNCLRLNVSTREANQYAIAKLIECLK